MLNSLNRSAAEDSQTHEVFDELDFAKAALRRVSDIAATLGARQTLCVAGCLAAKFCITERFLETADSAQLQRLYKRLPKLIDDVERICAWPKEIEPGRPILRSILRRGTYRLEREAAEQVERGIQSFACAPSLYIEQYFKKLDRFSKRVMKKHEDEKVNNNKKNDDDVEEYPAHVNTMLYSVLRDHLECTCVANLGLGMVEKRHHGRLRLRYNITKTEGCIAFDMLFSSSPDSWDYWQDFQLNVPMKGKKKSVKYQTDTLTPSVSNDPDQLKAIPRGALCKIVRSRLGCRICCWIRDSELYQQHDGSPIIQHVDSGPSTSLRDILQTHRLSNRMKLILAYTLCRSFWQYYDSPLMNTRWSSETIHFLPEPPEPTLDGHDGGASLNPLFYASKPYYAIEFTHDTDEFLEYCDLSNVIYRYPRLLALSIMLLEIARGESLLIQRRDSVEANLNNAWNLATSLLDESRPWGDFDYPQYRKVVASCLDQKIFHNPAPMEANPKDMDITMKKAIIYKTLVSPLHKLLSQLDFMDNINHISPMDSRGPGRRKFEIPAPIPIPNTEQNNDVAKSTKWLEKLSAVNEYIFNLRQEPFAAYGLKKRPVRIAVLDTGYDDESDFFLARSRARQIDVFKDFVTGSFSPIDENGHGTHTLALVMKVAPLADMYVARIATDRDSLSSSTKRISDAIRWATDDCDCDIVSMSFGFQEEVPCIREAIREAELRRQNRVLFFAAASNSGANRMEMFPATDDSVISIRETNSNGAFSDTNPPVNINEQVAYGTLGREVPSAWLRSVSGELSKSGSSVATAVAAGTAGIILTLAGVGFSNPALNLPTKVEKLWTRRGMLKMFEKMSQDMGNRCRYVSAPKFFAERDETEVWAAIIDVCA